MSECARARRRLETHALGTLDDYARDAIDLLEAEFAEGCRQGPDVRMRRGEGGRSESEGEVAPLRALSSPRPRGVAWSVICDAARSFEISSTDMTRWCDEEEGERRSKSFQSSQSIRSRWNVHTARSKVRSGWSDLSCQSS